jgi:serine/threonine-protein kinase
MDSIGRYQLVEKLGQGGMGVVYRAFDTLLHRVVAIKVISGSIDTTGEQRERFFREARAAGQLSHRNIITIHDLGEHEGQPYLAMEYLEGEDLQRRLASPDRMSLVHKVDLAIEICQGLEWAHARGVIHRDIKPANIFLTDTGTAKILDFGLARLVTSELTNSNMMMGTVNYMAPEQVRGERADHRSDIFSVGVLLYELLGGRKAFEAESFASTLYRILQDDPEPLQNRDPTIPSDLVAIVQRAMAKPRDERYQQMSEMLRDLALVRQQFGPYDTATGRPISGGHARPSDPPRPMSQPASDAPTVAHVPTPFPPAPSVQMPPVPAASGSAAAAPAASVAAVSRRNMGAGIGAGVLALVALVAALVWATRAGGPAETPAAAPAAPPAATAISDEALAAAVRRASSALDAGDFDGAVRHAETVLTQAPDHGEARRIRDRATATRESVGSGLQRARAHFAAGRFEDASREAGNVLSLLPSSQDARTLMEEAAARSQGSGATEARARMHQVKTAARAAGASDLAPAAYSAALGAERTADRLFKAGQLADATARFYEASGLFQSAELAARSAAAARAERTTRAEPRTPPASAVRAVEPPPSPPAPAAVVLPPPEPPPMPAGRGADPLPGAATSLPPAPPPAPKPSTPDPTPAPPAEPSADVQIADLLGRYETALEARSLSALKRVWPGLDGAQEAAIRNEFEHASRIDVEIASPRIEVAEGAATVTFTRRYELVTTDGQRLSSRSTTTMRCRRAAGGWVIEQVRFDPIR